MNGPPPPPPRPLPFRSDAVYVAEDYYAGGRAKDGSTSVEQISERYGAQAVVISIDPRRVYVKDPEDTKNKCVKTSRPGPDGEEYVWFQCTVKGGREGRDIGAYEAGSAIHPHTHTHPHFSGVLVHTSVIHGSCARLSASSTFERRVTEENARGVAGHAVILRTLAVRGSKQLSRHGVGQTKHCVV